MGRKSLKTVIVGYFSEKIFELRIFAIKNAQTRFEDVNVG